MFCKNCGKQLTDNVPFCDGCGAPQGAAPVQPPPNQPNYTAPQPFQPYSNLTSQQPMYQKTAFKGKQVSTGSSGHVQFRNGGKKGGCLKGILIGVGVLVVLLVALVLIGGSGLSNVKTAVMIEADTFEPVGVTSVFKTDSPEIFVTCTVSGLPIGTVVEGEWYYLDQDVFITSSTVRTTQDRQNLYFSLSRPDNGWPVGAYEVTLYVEGEEPVIASFLVN